MTRRSQQYPAGLRERAVRLVAEVTSNYGSQWAAINAVAQKLGVSTRGDCAYMGRQAEVDIRQRPGTTTKESAELSPAAQGERRAPPGQRVLEADPGLGAVRGPGHRAQRMIVNEACRLGAR